MKRFVLALAAVVSVAGSSGCCCLEKMFCCKPWACCDSPCGGCGDTCGDDCGCGGGCATGGCATGGCDSCGGYAGAPSTGGGCGPGGCGLAHGGCKSGCCSHNGIVAMPGTRNGAGMGPGGPPTAAVTYPYYTNRGPRDFLAKNPPSIGP